MTRRKYYAIHMRPDTLRAFSSAVQRARWIAEDSEHRSALTASAAKVKLRDIPCRELSHLFTGISV